MDFMIGCNYWASNAGTEMWRHYNGDEIRRDMALLKEYGVSYLRVFPNWRDFQPIDRVYGWRGRAAEYVDSKTDAIVFGDGVDLEMIENFRDFCHAAQEHGIKLVVSIVTGWMSGRLFVPPALKERDIITDPEAIMWMRRYVHRFVRELKNEKSIVMWDIGNECNCLGKAPTRSAAYAWCAAVVDSIRAEDQTRQIASGMHGLTSNGSSKESFWFIEDQGELCDVLTIHTYPSPTVKGDTEPYTRLRMTMLPTAQTLYYSGVSGKPAYVQESSTFTSTIGNMDMSADFCRIQILSSIANNLVGFQWWCAWDQSHLDFLPYTRSMIERQLGLFDGKKEPKPVAYVIKNTSALLNKLLDPLPKRMVDGAIVLSRETDHQDIAISSLILGKQAGVELEVCSTDIADIKDRGCYVLPAIAGWEVLYKETWDALLRKVSEGAILLITYNGGQLTDFEQIVGVTSLGALANTSHTAIVNGELISYTAKKELILKEKTARVVLRNESGNPLLTENSYGCGKVLFANFCPEENAFNHPDGFNKDAYYSIYGIAFGDIISSKPIRVDNKNIGVTFHPLDDSNMLVTLLNYSDKTVPLKLEVSEEYKISETIYGSLSELNSCDGTFLKLQRKKEK